MSNQNPTPAPECVTLERVKEFIAEKDTEYGTTWWSHSSDKLAAALVEYATAAHSAGLEEAAQLAGKTISADSDGCISSDAWDLEDAIRALIGNAQPKEKTDV